MSNKPTPRKKSPDYLDDWKEWQNHQFDPGHYTGGKLRLIFKNPGKPLWVGLGLLFTGLVTLGFELAAVSGFDPQTEDIIPFVLTNLPLLAISVILLLAGYRMIRRGSTR